MTERIYVWGGGMPPYISCSHHVCAKKARANTDHDCCGKHGCPLLG